MPKPIPSYRIYPLVNGRVTIDGSLAFVGGDPREEYLLLCYVWLILGGDKPALLCAGLKDIEQMNREAAHVLRTPLTQRPEETVRAQLRKFGLAPEDIAHVFITHLHFDHVDGLDDLLTAEVYIGKREWEAATDEACVDKWGNRWGNRRIIHEFTNNPQWKKRLHLVGDEELLPGIESFRVGGHTPGSMAYSVKTKYGTVVLPGDLVTLSANIERNIPPGINMGEKECYAGFARIREKADLVLASHDPDVLDRWPPAGEGRPKYTVRAIKVGECDVSGAVTFHGGNEAETHTFYLYVWVIEGGERPVVVDTGPDPRYIDEFNHKTHTYIPGGIRQKPEEETVSALKRHGIDPSRVSTVIVTHLHEDHYNYLRAFPSARFVVNRTEFEWARERLAPEVKKLLESRPERLRLAGDEEIVPGVRLVPLGGHTPGSQGVLVGTHMGEVFLTGDVVYLYENIEKNRPANPGITPDPSDRPPILAAMRKIRSQADIVLPAHDPLTLERWPEGVVGGRQIP